jgi:hypothetical protein
MAHIGLSDQLGGHQLLAAGRANDSLEAAKAAAEAVVPGVAGVSGPASVGEAVPPLRVVEAVHGPAGGPVLAAISGSLPGVVSSLLGVAGRVLS